jgi:hypothetical protein
MESIKTEIFAKDTIMWRYVAIKIESSPNRNGGQLTKNLDPKP